MKGTLDLPGGGGGGRGGSSGGSSNESSVSNEASSYPTEAELELGLGLSLGRCSGGKVKPFARVECGRILTAKDFTSVVSHGVGSATFGSVSGTKRAADSVPQEDGFPTGGSQVVGWPPIRAYRMNSLVNQAKSPRAEGDKAFDEKEKSKDSFKKKSNNTNCSNNEKGHLGFVKVNMDGVAIGRKLDLNAHSCYESLAQTLEDMFLRTKVTVNSIGGEKEQIKKLSNLLDGSSEFVLTYEDKDGDWMLVGDVPWRMFLSSVRRLRIMRTSEANGLAPRFQQRNERICKPI